MPNLQFSSISNNLFLIYDTLTWDLVSPPLSALATTQQNLQPAFPPTHRISSLCSPLALKVLSCAPYIYPLTLGTQPVILAPSISGNSLSSTVQPCGQGVVPPRTLLTWQGLILMSLPKLPQGPSFPGPDLTFSLALVFAQPSTCVSLTLSVPNLPSPTIFARVLSSCHAPNLSVFSIVLSVQVPLGFPLLWAYHLDVEEPYSCLAGAAPSSQPCCPQFISTAALVTAVLEFNSTPHLITLPPPCVGLSASFKERLKKER